MVRNMRALPQEKRAGGPYRRLSIPVRKRARHPFFNLELWQLDLAWVFKDTCQQPHRKSLSSVLVLCLSVKMVEHLGAQVFHNVLDIPQENH